MTRDSAQQGTMPRELGEKPDVNRRPALKLVTCATPAGEALEESLQTAVRAARRDVSRLLRGMQASGRGLGRLPDLLTSRLAHADSVSALYLIADARVEEQEVKMATRCLREVERWLLMNLSPAEITEVRAHGMRTRISEDELTAPLVYADWTGSADGDREIASSELLESSAMREAIALLSDQRIVAVCRRLGIALPHVDVEGAKSLSFELVVGERRAAEQAILSTLFDAQLLAILVATLPGEAHRLLAALIRGKVDSETHRRLQDALQEDEVAISSRLDATRPNRAPPAVLLRDCGLIFYDCTASRLWVPVELQHRVDGVLRSFGV